MWYLIEKLHKWGDEKRKKIVENRSATTKLMKAYKICKTYCVLYINKVKCLEAF